MDAKQKITVKRFLKLWRADWNGMSVIAPTRKEARKLITGVRDSWHTGK